MRLSSEFLAMRGPEGPLNLNADAQNSAQVNNL